MRAGLDVGLIVGEQVEDVMAFVFVGTDDARLYRDVIGNQGVSDNTFVEAEVGSFRVSRSCDECLNEAGQKGLTSTTHIVHKLKEPQIQRQLRL
jgi:hypothetical protein